MEMAEKNTPEMKQFKKLTDSEKRAKRMKLRRLINEVYTLSTDPHLKLNAIGMIQCKLCNTQHNTEASYIVHRNSKKHRLLSDKKINEKQSLRHPPKYKIYKVKRKYNKKECALSTSNHNTDKNNTDEHNTNEHHPDKHHTNEHNADRYKIGYLIEIKTPIEIQYKIIDSSEQSTEQPFPNYKYLVIKTYNHDNIGIRLPKREYNILKWFDGHTYKIQILYDETP